MPTGYTAKIYEGEDQSFAEFATECARAFGALIELRDSPTAPIPEKFEPSPYHLNRLLAAENELRRWQEMSDDEVAADLRREQDVVLAYRQEIIDVAEERESRYQAMLDQVEAWTPPTDDHQGLKNFMIRQITDSIRNDCSTTYLPSPPPDDVDAWRQDRIEYNKRQIDYHAKYYSEECERAEGRTGWIRALLDSLDFSSA